jgi:hypothetical protein
MKIAKVEWLDSVGAGSSWTPLSVLREVPNNATCTSVGYILRYDEESITIIPHIYGSDEKLGLEESGCGEMTIPSIAIVNMTILENDLPIEEE